MAPNQAPQQAADYVDVLIVGAGLSGIGAAWHLQKRCPGLSWAIVEAREAIGGTWDLFRYPGVRSDSDMYTLGYRFRPWLGDKAIADGADILSYVRATARDSGIEQRIRFQHRLVSAAWSSAQSRWTVTLQRGPAGERCEIACNFLFLCTGYYDYENGFLPEFPGLADFAGPVLHPQFWPRDLDYSGKRVAVIGSGATAMTLVPAMAATAAHVAMIQRSPTYVIAHPARDAIAAALRRILPAAAAYVLTRWKNLLLGMYFYHLCMRRPDRARSLILKGVRQMLGPNYDIARHFTPSYKPWTQRLCLVPDGDLFRAIRKGRVSMVTGDIDRIVRDGVRMKSGETIAADMLVTATGLILKGWGGATLSVDGEVCDLARSLTYKGMMFTGVPNMALWSGYTNASWTLKADLISDHVCRLLNHMQRHGHGAVVARNDDPGVTTLPWVDLTSGYILRALDKFPKQGSKPPWRLHQNYIRDLLSLRFGTIADPALKFSGTRS